MEPKKPLSTHIKEHPFIAWAIGATLICAVLLVLWPALTYDGRYRAARISYFVAVATLPLTVLVVVGQRDKGGKPKKELGALALLGVIVLSGAFLLGVVNTADLVVNRLVGAPVDLLTREAADSLVKNHEPLLMETVAEMYIPSEDKIDAEWSPLSSFISIRQGGAIPADWAQDAATPAWDKADKQVSAHPDKPHSPAMAQLFKLASLSRVTRYGAEVVFESGKYDKPAYTYLYYSPGDRYIWPPYRIGNLADEPATRVCADENNKARFTIVRLAPNWFYVSPVAGA